MMLGWENRSANVSAACAAKNEILILAGAVALAIALLTVAFQAVKAALSDPIKILKYE
jgi:predicted tellurium resistance membrane protein TerC